MESGGERSGSRATEMPGNCPFPVLCEEPWRRPPLSRATPGVAYQVTSELAATASPRLYFPIPICRECSEEESATAQGVTISPTQRRLARYYPTPPRASAPRYPPSG